MFVKLLKTKILKKIGKYQVDKWELIFKPKLSGSNPHALNSYTIINNNIFESVGGDHLEKNMLPIP